VVFDAVFWVIVGAIVLSVTWAIWGQISDATSPTYRLRKDQWSCTLSHTLHFAGGGKTGTHQSRRVVCDQYTRSSLATPADRLRGQGGYLPWP
jgi:hypothetical protein